MLKDRKAFDLKAREVVESELFMIEYSRLPPDWEDENERNSYCGKTIDGKILNLIHRGRKSILKHSASVPSSYFVNVPSKFGKQSSLN